MDYHREYILFCNCADLCFSSFFIFFKYRSTNSKRVLDGRGTEVEGALKEKRRMCDRKYHGN